MYNVFTENGHKNLSKEKKKKKEIKLIKLSQRRLCYDEYEVLLLYKCVRKTSVAF